MDWVFAYLWGCKFIEAEVLNFKTKTKFVFVKDVNLWARAAQKYHENWATMNANDFTVLRIKLEHALQKLCYIKEALMNLCLWQIDSKAGFESCCQ